MSRLNSINAVVTLFRDQIHSLESGAIGAPVPTQADGAASPILDDGEQRKKSGMSTTVPAHSDGNVSAETDLKKKSSAHSMMPSAGKEEQAVAAVEDALLVFSEASLNQLQRRTEELKTERTMQKNKFR